MHRTTAWTAGARRFAALPALTGAPTPRFGPALIGALAIFAIAVPATRAQAATTAGAVVSNGTVQLGVNSEGSLNYDCATEGDTGCPDPSAEDRRGRPALRPVEPRVDRSGLSL